MFFISTLFGDFSILKWCRPPSWLLGRIAELRT